MIKVTIAGKEIMDEPECWGVLTLLLLEGIVAFGKGVAMQNAEKVTHIKGRQLDQAMILFNYVPFQNGNFS